MTAKIIHDGKNRDAWLGARDIGVGASEVPILFGCGYGDSAQLDLYARKIGARVPKFEPDEGMVMGTELEPTIIRLTCERAGIEPCEKSTVLYGNDAFPNLVCTPDAITLNGEPVEVKNICHRIDESEWECGIPFKYELQLQSAIANLEAKRGLFGALLFGGRLVWTWLDRDDALIGDIKSRVATFWRHVRTRTPCAPNGTKSSRQAAVAVANELPPKEIFDGDMDQAVLDYEYAKSDEAYAKRIASAAEQKRKTCEDSIILAMGGASKAVTASGWQFIRTVSKRKASTTKASETHGLKVLAPKEEQGEL
jgi:predicted phage-related endonuclease